MVVVGGKSEYMNVWVWPHPSNRSLDEIHHNRNHSLSPARYHDTHLERQRSGDSDYEYSEDR